MRVLLIEDNPHDVRLLRLNLEDAGHRGMELVHASTLTEALMQLAGDLAEPFDAALLDLGLTDADGMFALASLLEADPQLPVVVLTGRQDPDFAARAVGAGAQDYLFKDTADADAVMRSLRYARERQAASQRLEHANSQLAASLAALERRTHTLEELSALGDALRACRKEQEVAVALHDALPRLFPGCSGALVSGGEPLLRWGDDPWEQGDAHLLDAGEPPVALWLHLPPQGNAASGSDEAGAATPPLDDHRTGLLPTLVRQLALTLANLRLTERLRQQSVRDPLTGLFNRRYLHEAAERELGRAERTDESVSVMFVDIDRFKGINDAYGHAVGDAVLAALGAALSDNFRQQDVVARYGGEEFVLLLPGAPLPVAQRRAEDLRRRVAREVAGVVAERTGCQLPLTLSLGVAAFPDHGARVDELLEAADRACYRAKSSGRDRVLVADAVA